VDELTVFAGVGARPVIISTNVKAYRRLMTFLFGKARFITTIVTVISLLERAHIIIIIFIYRIV